MCACVDLCIDVSVYMHIVLHSSLQTRVLLHPPHTGIASIEWFAEEAKRVCGDDLASTLRNRRMQIWKEPIGVVGAITVWCAVVCSGV